ncbi:hydroxyphenylacetyl-CoA thioesterase PaaI [Tardiphaga sp. 37S4]|uniref:hydroxyphenylacetyl-CoA thioesterase PaaI n=1 Tax=Tardiphaga sp. 37S4 TaxID=1404741 RepID=UPI001E3333E8|nr:hydroxyphenylacetyl-CoA thioesterase PaaI [Tardiphaga sp. 37S4]UFS76467.1 hydroxyphenylacetyl-CoA thioesterase PaaI [Tardiphaga sp. 37S4]
MESREARSGAAAQTMAQACAAAMWHDDRASKALGMSIQRVAPGEAVLAMTVRPDMTNGHDICHGGFIFTLADSAFAFACNSYNQRAVAQQCAVTFIRAVAAGETLTAHAIERSKAGRGGIYDVTVRDSKNVVVAEFRGHSRTISGELLPPNSTLAQ